MIGNGRYFPKKEYNGDNVALKATGIMLQMVV